MFSILEAAVPGMPAFSILLIQIKSLHFEFHHTGKVKFSHVPMHMAALKPSRPKSLKDMAYWPGLCVETPWPPAFGKESVDMLNQPHLADNFGRRFPYLRLSVTDVCNFSCSYCLPDGY